jgi:hypothetical protein
MEPSLFLLIVQLIDVFRIPAIGEEDPSSLIRAGDGRYYHASDTDGQIGPIQDNAVDTFWTSLTLQSKEKHVGGGCNDQEIGYFVDEDLGARLHQLHTEDGMLLFLEPDRDWIRVGVIPKIQLVVYGHPGMVDLGEQTQGR